MSQERPNPDVDVSFPDGIDLHRFNFAIAGLAAFGMDAMAHGDVPKAQGAADLQLALLMENPEAAILMDEVFGDVIHEHLPNKEADGIVGLLEAHGALEDVDVEAVRDRVDTPEDGGVSPDTEDMTEIDIE